MPLAAQTGATLADLMKRLGVARLPRHITMRR